VTVSPGSFSLRMSLLARSMVAWITTF